ncbi:hypothetical protein CYMTET_36100, partial [Cymbomonas tetramitiformis]
MNQTSNKIFPEEGEVLVEATETPHVPGVPQPLELESRNEHVDEDVATPPTAALAMCNKYEDTKTLKILAKSLGVSAIALNRWEVTLQRLPSKKREELQASHFDECKAVAILQLLATPMATSALEGWQGSLSKATLGTHDDGEIAEQIVGEGLKTTLGKEVGEVLVAVSVALHAWRSPGTDSCDAQLALAKQARRCARALSATALTEDWRSAIPSGTRLLGGTAQDNRDLVTKAIVFGSGYAVAARVSLERDIRAATSMASQHEAAWWCGQCMRCRGLAVLMSDGLRDGSRGARFLQPVLMDVVES